MNNFLLDQIFRRLNLLTINLLHQQLTEFPYIEILL